MLRSFSLVFFTKHFILTFQFLSNINTNIIQHCWFSYNLKELEIVKGLMNGFHGLFINRYNINESIENNPLFSAHLPQFEHKNLT